MTEEASYSEGMCMNCSTEKTTFISRIEFLEDVQSKDDIYIAYEFLEDVQSKDDIYIGYRISGRRTE